MHRNNKDHRPHLTVGLILITAGQVIFPRYATMFYALSTAHGIWWIWE